MDNKELNLHEVMEQIRFLSDSVKERGYKAEELSEEQKKALNWVVGMLARVEALAWWFQLIGKSKWLIAAIVVLYTQGDKISETLQVWGTSK